MMVTQPNSGCRYLVTRSDPGPRGCDESSRSFASSLSLRLASALTIAALTRATSASNFLRSSSWAASSAARRSASASASASAAALAASSSAVSGFGCCPFLPRPVPFLPSIAEDLLGFLTCVSALSSSLGAEASTTWGPLSEPGDFGAPLVLVNTLRLRASGEPFCDPFSAAFAALAALAAAASSRSTCNLIRWLTEYRRPAF
mmetsp:Transcript_13631/g.27428  ORF Transcript_13631/g.27428 Transcript_13631/m.27428 type:complete len:203 (+) Transcript_13631:1259-1867(+)